MSALPLTLDVARVLILTSVAGSAATEDDVRARTDQPVSLHAALEVAERSGCVLYTDAPKARSRCAVRPPPANARITWSKVEADAAAYDNVPGGRFSLADIGWIESPWTEGAWTVPADVTPIVRRGVAGAGTMRYRAHVEVLSRRFSSPGLERGEPGGPARDIRKVALRPGDGYLDLMLELAGLPYIFGSTAIGRAPHQAERGVGVDCADLVIYGLRRLGHELGYRSSRTLGPVSRRMATGVTLGDDGAYRDARGQRLTIGRGGLLPGDWMIFEGHVGALAEDRGVIGVLDREDLLLHIAWRELAVEPLGDTPWGHQRIEIRRPEVLRAAETLRGGERGVTLGR